MEREITQQKEFEPDYHSNEQGDNVTTPPLPTQKNQNQKQTWTCTTERIQNEQAVNIEATCQPVSQEQSPENCRYAQERCCRLFMLATLIICSSLISLGRGLCSAHTYSCEGWTSCLHRTAYRHEIGVIANQAESCPEGSLPEMCFSFGSMWCATSNIRWAACLRTTEAFCQFCAHDVIPDKPILAHESAGRGGV